jgi:transcriptional regulator GlxA family with amidase domain
MGREGARRHLAATSPVGTTSAGRRFPFHDPRPHGRFPPMAEPLDSSGLPGGARTASAPSPSRPLRADPERVDLVLWDGVELLDLAGPGQVFATAGFRVRTLAAHPGALQSQGFLTIQPEGLLADALAGPPPGVLVVPGGSSERAVADALLVDGVARAARATLEGGGLVFSVCTGAMVLAAAGLLDGLEATTWKGALDRLQAAAPRTRVRRGVRWVDNGSVITAAGVSAGIDAALHLVERLRGPGAREAAAQYMEYPAHPAPAADAAAPRDRAAPRDPEASRDPEAPRDPEASRDTAATRDPAISPDPAGAP